MGIKRRITEKKSNSKQLSLDIDRKYNKKRKLQISDREKLRKLMKHLPRYRSVMSNTRFIARYLGKVQGREFRLGDKNVTISLMVDHIGKKIRYIGVRVFYVWDRVPHIRSHFDLTNPNADQICNFFRNKDKRI